MEYIPLLTLPHYADCSPLAEGLGYALVELRIGHTKSQYQVRAVITRKEGADSIGINDCARFHRLALPRLEALLHSDNVYIEVTSPGTDRQIKNAAEFALFCGKRVRVWDAEITDWVAGVILEADSAALTLEIDGARKTVPYEKIAKARLLNA